MKKSKILLVDDRPENLVALTTTLRELKEVELITAAGGQEALVASLNHNFALIILDVQMPKMDGYELAGYLREEEKTRDVPIIFMSAVHSEDYHAYHSKDTGAVDFLTKPYNPQTLLNKTDLLVTLQRQKAELEDTNQELQQQHQELKHTQSQLVEAAKLASIGTLTSGIAHELNQPLSVIMLAVAEAQECLEDQDYEALSEVFERIERNVKRSAAITKHMRNFGGELVKESPEPEGLELLVKQALVLVQNKLEKNNVKIELEFADGLPQVTGKLKQLEQAIGNLLFNAQDALREAPEKVLRIRGFEEEKRLVLSIEDTGCGIPEDVLPHIFDPFFTTKSVGQGQGLGLSAGYGIIKQHGGELTVESTVGKGSCFRIALPK